MVRKRTTLPADNTGKPARMPGWTIPDAPREIRAIAISEAKRRGMKLHEFVTQAIMAAVGNSMDGKNVKEGKKDNYADLAARLAVIEARLGIDAPPPVSSATPAKPSKKVGNVGVLTEEERRLWFKPPKFARLTDAGETEIAARHAAGQSVGEIAAAFGYSGEGVKRVLARLMPQDAPESP